jgi:hypothetical protein
LCTYEGLAEASPAKRRVAKAKDFMMIYERKKKEIRKLLETNGPRPAVFIPAE